MLQKMEENVAKILDNDIKNINKETMITLLNVNWKDILGKKPCLILKPPEPILESLIKHNLIDLKNDTFSDFDFQYQHAASYFNFSNCKSEQDCAIDYIHLVYDTIEISLQHVDPQKLRYTIGKDTTQSNNENSTHQQTDYNKLFVSIQNEKEIKNSHKRLDFLLMDLFGRILIRGEEKLHPQHLSLAKKEIETKSFKTNAQHYSSIKYSFAYAAAGSSFHLFLIDNDNDKSECDEKNLLYIYDLYSVIDIFKLVTNMICIFHICHLQSGNNKPTAIYYQLFQENKKSDGNCTYQYCGDNTVLKKVKLNPMVSCEHSKKIEYLTNLKEFYELLNNANVSNAIKLKSLKVVKTDELHILTTPICQNEIKSNIKSLKEFKFLIRCLFNVLGWMHSKCFIHNDIRWPNIVYDMVKEQYLLIDFENVRRVCKGKCSNHGQNNCPMPKNDL